VTATTSLSPSLARQIIQSLGGSGTPPEYGLEHFSVGLAPYLDVIDDEYLNGYIKDGGANFKMVIGIYGGGKTHFLYCLRDRAWQHGYAVSYVSLKSSGESPFYALELVYKAIVANIGATPHGDAQPNHERGIRAFLKNWYGERIAHYQRKGMSVDRSRQSVAEDIQQVESPNLSFRNAIRHALDAYHNDRQETFDTICQWLQGEGFDSKTLRTYGITQKIDRTTAFQMIRSLGQIIRALEYQGLVVLLDEAERIPSLSTRNREQHLSNLREIIDECGQSSFEGMLLVYAVPDENFLRGRTQIYEALTQRLNTVFSTLNPTGVKIMLERTVNDHISFLQTVGERLAEIYCVAYTTSLDSFLVKETVAMVAEWAEEQRFSDEGYKRLFVQNMIKALHYLRLQGKQPSIADLA